MGRGGDGGSRLTLQAVPTATAPIRYVQVVLVGGATFTFQLHEDAHRAVALFTEGLSAGAYDGAQASNATNRSVSFVVPVVGEWRDGAIPLEFNRRHFVPGSVAMQHLEQKHTAGFAIVRQQDATGWDGNFTNFGQVVEGQDVVDTLDATSVIFTIRTR